MRRHVHGIAGAAVRVAVVGWFVFATIVIALRYVVVPNVAHYRGDVERLASRATHETVTIGAMEASWRGLRPALALRDVRVVAPDGTTTLVVPAVDATLSWETLAVFQLRLASLDIDRPSVQVSRDADGRIVVAGYPLQQKTPPDRRGAEWLLAQNAIRIHGATVTWHDEASSAGAIGPRPDLVLTDIAFAIERTGWRHRVALRATPPATLAAPIDVRAVVDHRFLSTRLADPAEWRGTLYADVATGDVTAWKTWLPLPPTVDGGRGRARAWMTFDRADDPAGVFARRLAERIKRPIPAELDRIASVTADLALDDVGVKWGAMSDAPEYTSVGSIDGRLVGSQTMTEQHVAGIRMALEPRVGAKVPPTDFDVRRTIGRDAADESGTASIGAIDIAVSLGLVPAPLVPAPIAEKLAALKPRGILERVAVRWTGPVATPATFECDARFARLAVAPQAPTPEAIAAAARVIVGANGLVRKPRPAFGQPGFAGIDGTLKAVRTKAAGDAVAVTRATLDLSGANVTISAPGLFDDPTLRLAHVAAKVGVQASGPEFEVKVDRASVDNADVAADLGLTFRRGPKSGGVVDKDGTPGRGWIDLDAHVSRADVARVARYLPTVIGERARVYLQRSLVSGKVVDASVRVRGALEHLSPRDQPDALAATNPVTVQNALAAVRDRPAAVAPAAESRSKDDAGDTVLHALVKVRGATFLYGPARRPSDPLPAKGVPPSATAYIAWPAFDDVDADVVFDHAKMTVRARTARVYDYRLTDITAELPALADPAHVLRVVGRGTGPMQDLVRFVNNSPISRWLRRFTEATQATGNAGLALALDLPLTHPRDTELAASLQFGNNDVTLNRIVPPLMHVVGRLDFTDRGLAIDNLKADALGGPLRIDATTRKDGYIELKAAGTVDVAGLQKQMQESANEGVETPVALDVDRAARIFSGSTHYDVDLRVRSKRVADFSESGLPPEPSSQPDLVVRSDLKGLAIALPEPFAKPADASWPLRVELARSISSAASAGPSVPDVEDVHIALADRVDVRLSRKRTGDGPFVATRAGYRIGAGAASTTGPSELHVELPTLDVDAWREAMKDVAPTRSPAADHPPPSPAVDALLPTRATVKIGTVKAFDRTIDHLDVAAERLAAGWQADVTADQVAGRVSYTDVSGKTDTRTGVAATSTAKLVARLSRLSIPQSESGGGGHAKPIDASGQRDFPAIDVVVDRFDLRGRTLGRLEVAAENVDGADGGREWHLDRVGLTTPEARFTGHGVWGHGGGPGDASAERTSLEFELQASDVGALLDRFGMTRTINQGTAQLSGHAAWNGGPSTIDFESMSGKLRLAADKGQFLKAEPGVAKLLNILSLQGLARRLTLDFSDVFSPGFAFDTVRADATVDHGIATTNDFTMRGVEAVVRMSGSADLAHETTDLHVVVEPQINAGAASLGVAVVNPIVGLATFAAQYLFKDRISKALSFEYNVVGPWSKPVVTKIDRHGNVTPVVPKKRADGAAANADSSKERTQ